MAWAQGLTAFESGGIERVRSEFEAVARSALNSILTIRVGIALALMPMLYQGLSANIMSLQGIAVPMIDGLASLFAL